MREAAEFGLAAALASYPDDESAGRVLRAASEAGVLGGSSASESARSAARALAAAGSVELAALESEYIDLFDRGLAENPLFGTGYRRNRSHAGADRLSDVVEFYRLFGSESKSRERVDHVSVELEFYGWLVRKSAHLERIGDFEGAGNLIDARRRFLVDHLAPLAAAIARRPAIRASAAYGPVFVWIASLVADEAARLGVAFEPLELAAAETHARAVAGARTRSARETELVAV